MSESSGVIVNVDDDPTNRFAVSRILRKEGFEVREGASGAEALLLAGKKPALMILDINLPDMSGFEVCRRLKADPATASIAILHLSAQFVQMEERVAGLEGGADGYLILPVDPSELLATVRALLRLRGAEEAARQMGRQWQETFDAITDGVCLVDREGKVLQANNSLGRWLSRPAPEVVGRPIQEWLPDADNADGPFRRMLRSRRREMGETKLVDRVCRVTLDPMLAADGELRGGVFIFADMAETHRADRAEAEAERQSQRAVALEEEIRRLGSWTNSPSVTVTAQLYGAQPLSQSAPGQFTECIERYGRLLEQAVEQRDYKVRHPISEQLREMGDFLGFLSAGPRDVAAVYSAALKAKSAAAERMEVYVSEGRLMALELMGHLAAYYRVRAVRSREAPAPPISPPGASPP